MSIEENAFYTLTSVVFVGSLFMQFKMSDQSLI